MNEQSRIGLTAVVCTYNRRGFLGRCIESLIGQDYAEPYEVIVVDDGSSDGTSELVGDLEGNAPPNVRFRFIRHEKNRGLGAARNTAVKHASGDVVAFTDDDTVVSPDWVATLARCYEAHPEVSAVGGLVLNGHPDSTIAEIGQQIVTSRLTGSVFDGNYTRFIVGNNQSYRKNAIESVGGFEEELIYGGEEAEIQLRLQDNGHKMLFTRDATVTHYQRNSLALLVKQYYRYGIGLNATRVRHMADGGRDLTGGATESWAKRVWRVISQPSAVSRHLDRPIQRILCYPVVYLSSLSRFTGFLVSKLRRGA